MSSRLAFLAAVAFLAACSSRPVVIRGVPDDAAKLSLFYNLVGGHEVPPEHIYFTLDGRLAVEDLPPSATRVTSVPLLAAEARRADGCLLASATTQGFEITLRPVVDCGRVAPTPPTPPAQAIVDIRPEPPKDSDGDGVLDANDLCPDVAAGATPSPTRKGCPDGDQDGDGVVDGLDVCPTLAAGKYPEVVAARRGCPQADRDGDGIPDSLDKCPSLPAGSTPSTSRAGCPAPVDVVIPLGPPSLSGSVMASGADAFTARADFDFVTGKPVAGVLQWPVTLPAQAATASSITVSFDLSVAGLSWGATSPSCAAGAFLVRSAGTSQACVVGGLEDVLLVDDNGNVGGAGMVSTFSRQGGNVSATPTSRLALRLSLRGDVVASGVKAAVRVTMSW